MPQPTGELIPGIYAIRNNMPFVNFFLVRVDENKYIAIDAGIDSTQSLNELNKINIFANNVVAVFLTHAHFDHIGSLSIFINANVFSGNTTLLDIPHQIMADGEIMEISGVFIKCIYTPGHTKDSVSYLINEKYLFVGDSLVNHPNNEDNEQKKHSIEKLANIDGIEYIFTAHHGFTRNVRRTLSQ